MYLIDYIVYRLHLRYKVQIFNEVCGKPVSQHPGLATSLLRWSSFLVVCGFQPGTSTVPVLPEDETRRRRRRRKLSYLVKLRRRKRKIRRKLSYFQSYFEEDGTCEFTRFFNNLQHKGNVLPGIMVVSGQKCGNVGVTLRCVFEDHLSFCM